MFEQINNNLTYKLFDFYLTLCKEHVDKNLKDNLRNNEKLFNNLRWKRRFGSIKTSFVPIHFYNKM